MALFCRWNAGNLGKFLMNPRRRQRQLNYHCLSISPCSYPSTQSRAAFEPSGCGLSRMDSFLLWSYAPLVMRVLLLDVIFNVTWGTIIFRELPREWLFTQRVQRHMHDTDNHVVRLWARRLNFIEPGHV